MRLRVLFKIFGGVLRVQMLAFCGKLESRCVVLNKCDGGLGFKDIENLNDALSAKQFWRLHCVPNSLFAWALKVKYFPDVSIWESLVGHNPSYVWRSIWSVRHIVDKGSRWCIGDGKCIQIWKDSWVAGFGSGKIISPRHGLNDSAIDVTIVLNTSF
ncbi:uncharacterized mitochondrial protein AtMg00310-like [Amaranthus tricolor]|uniref:uncharacterized mitochondrial protein AtMg00310-like n=1 Tax=Amaranthus tricolor TaxID=29722 RepID=UPI00258E15DD|nr:uncharacterized mitochondrial protein AtMg00310-like [Amaranthus tricolor]